MDEKIAHKFFHYLHKISEYSNHTQLKSSRCITQPKRHSPDEYLFGMLEFLGLLDEYLFGRSLGMYRGNQSKSAS
jgi:hypothetical protein